MILKRIFDIVFSLIGLLILSPVILIMALLAAIDTSSTGIFLQTRVGQHAKLFKIIKLRSIGLKSNRISPFGKFLRRSKIDELPQLYNVLVGDMSFVGPRPDIPGYYDVLQGEDRKILLLKPGLTSLASIKYFNEDVILSQQNNPLRYNDTVLFPDKVKMNLDYFHTRTFADDLRIIAKTIAVQIL